MEWLRKLTGRRGQGGFTLIELMIALAILGLILTTLYRVFTTQERFMRGQELAMVMQEDLRSLSEFLNQEISWVGYKCTGLSVLKAGHTELIFRANLPGTGGTISFVRYFFDSAGRRFQRAVASDYASVQTATLKTLAENVDNVRFDYYDLVGSMLLFGAGTATPTDPLFTTTWDNSLLAIQRIRATLRVRSYRQESNYVDPVYGDHYYRRSGVIDVKMRNVEDVAAGGAGGAGKCTDFDIDVSPNEYAACSDKYSVNLADNPKFHVFNVKKPDGTWDNTTPVALSAPYGYIFVNSALTQLSGSTNRTSGAEDLWLLIGPNSTGSIGSSPVTVTARMTPPEAGCVERQRDLLIDIRRGAASHLDTTAAYATGGMALQYIIYDRGVPLDPAPAALPVCAATENVAVRLTARVVDDCGNGIPGQTVSFTASKGSFSSGTTDNGDGTYSIVYIPPDSITGASETADIQVSWGAESYTRSLTLVTGAPKDIVILDIAGPKDGLGAWLYQFAKTGPSSFQIERLSNQHVRIDFAVVDGCGNRVFSELTYLTAAASYGNVTALTANPDGTYTFEWFSPFGCGAGLSGQDITIRDSRIPAALPTWEQKVDFNLLTTSNSATIVLSLSSLLGLTSGCTDDEVTVTTQIQKYDPVKDTCVNVPGPFPVVFTVTGQVGGLGNGAWSHTNLTQTTITATADGTGVATAVLNPGTTRLGQTLIVGARADVEGALSPEGTIAVGTRPTSPGAKSGFYDAAYLVKKGTFEASRAFNPGSPLYLQLQDCDKNADVQAVDSLSSPFLTVVLLSELTGDREVVKLTETGANTAIFRPNDSLYGSDHGFPTQNSVVAVPGDNRLQVTWGDKVTLAFKDVDSGIENNYSWEVYTSGPRSLTLYRRNADGSEDPTPIVSGGLQNLEVSVTAYPRFRPKVYFPMYASDGILGANTCSITVSSLADGETDTVLLREQGDSGVFIPDAAAYGGRDFIRISTSSTPVGVNPAVWLQLPYTPKMVRTTYPASGPTAFVTDMTVKDTNAPRGSITSPPDGSTVSGDVPVVVYVEDYQDFIAPAIKEIRLHLDGYYLTSLSGTDLTGSNAFTWRTVYAGVPRYLDGTHTLSALASDSEGNWGWTPAIQVVLRNNLNTVWFSAPPYNAVVSSTVYVEVRTAPLGTAPAGGGYTATLNAGGANYPMSPVGPDAFGYTLWVRPLPDGSNPLFATVSRGAASSTAAWAIEVDHTPPNVAKDPWPEWIPNTDPWGMGGWDVWFGFNVTDVHGFADSSNDVRFSINGLPPVTNKRATWSWSTPGGAGNIAYYWCTYHPLNSAYTGTFRWVVTASDSCSPANWSTTGYNIPVDTILPVIDAPTLEPHLYSFIKGTVGLRTRIRDRFPNMWNLWMWNAMTGTSGWLWGTFSAGSDGSIFYTWDTLTGTAPGSGMPWTNGPYQIQIWGNDLAGNAPTTWTYWTYYVDNGAPTFPWTSIPSFAVSTSSLQYMVDANWGAVLGVGEGLFSLSDGSLAGSSRQFFPLAGWTTIASRAYSWDSRGVENGDYRLVLYAADWAGNASSVNFSPLMVCNRIVAVAGTLWVDRGSHKELQVNGFLVQLTPGGRVPMGGADIQLVVEDFTNPTHSGTVAFQTLPDGTFACNTPPSQQIQTGDRVRYQIVNTTSGCNPMCGVDKPNYYQTVP